jgi:hypothetical protein
MTTIPRFSAITSFSVQTNEKGPYKRVFGTANEKNYRMYIYPLKPTAFLPNATYHKVQFTVGAATSTHRTFFLREGKAVTVLGKPLDNSKDPDRAVIAADAEKVASGLVA